MITNIIKKILILPAGVDALDSSLAGVALAAASDFLPLAGAEKFMIHIEYKVISYYVIFESN